MHFVCAPKSVRALLKVSAKRAAGAAELKLHTCAFVIRPPSVWFFVFFLLFRFVCVRYLCNIIHARVYRRTVAAVFGGTQWNTVCVMLCACEVCALCFVLYALSKYTGGMNGSSRRRQPLSIAQCCWWQPTLKTMAYVHHHSVRVPTTPSP